MPVSAARQRARRVQHLDQKRRQDEALQARRAAKEKFQKEKGLKGVELFEKMATLYVEEKVKACENRCRRCWHDAQSGCICRLIPCAPRDSATLPVKALVLMHYKEYLGAGNSGKLLPAILPPHSRGGAELFVFGREGDWDKFAAECSVDQAHTIVLWPGKGAMPIGDYLSQLPTTSEWKRQMQKKQAQFGAREIHDQKLDRDSHDYQDSHDSQVQARSESAGDQAAQDQAGLPTLRVVILDGVYSQARNMFKALRRLPGGVPPHISLNPPSESVFRRAQKTYAKASMQVRNDAAQDSLPTASDDNQVKVGAVDHESDLHNSKGEFHGSGEGNSSTNACKDQPNPKKQATTPARRVCSVEAFAYLLFELGELPELPRLLVDAIKVNNAALDQKQEVCFDIRFLVSCGGSATNFFFD